MMNMYLVFIPVVTASYVSTSPLTSASFFVLSVLLMLPLLSVMTYAWVAYLVAMLYMSGVFVLLVYFAGMSKVYYKPVSGSWFLVLSHMVVMPMYPFVLTVPLELNMTFLYEPEQLFYVVFLVVALLMYMLFVSYMLGAGSTMRRL